MTKAKDDGDDDVYVQPEVPTQWSDTFCNSKLILVIWELPIWCFWHTWYSSQNFGYSLFTILSPSSLFISSLIAFFTCDKGNIIRGKLTCGRTTMGDIWRHSEPEVNKQCRHRLRYCTSSTGSWTVQRVVVYPESSKSRTILFVWLNFITNTPPYWLLIININEVS